MGICYCKGAEEIADERNTEINVSRRFGIEENKEGVVTNGRNGSKQEKWGGTVGMNSIAKTCLLLWPLFCIFQSFNY